MPLINNWQAVEASKGSEAREGLYRQVPNPVQTPPQPASDSNAKVVAMDDFIGSPRVRGIDAKARAGWPQKTRRALDSRGCGAPGARFKAS